MSDAVAQKQLLEKMALLFKRFEKSGDLAQIENRSEWEKLVASKLPDERELLTELARFVDLWRYLQERGHKLGTEIVGAVNELHQLPVPERIASLKKITRKLMERVGDVSEGAQFRQ